MKNGDMFGYPQLSGIGDADGNSFNDQRSTLCSCMYRVHLNMREKKPN